MGTHQAVQVESAGGPLGLVEVATTSPGRDHVRIDVAACGVCGTDRPIINGAFPGLAFPLTPGHEIAGTIAEMGSGVEGFAVGDRVAVGWFGGNCNHCIRCRKGDFITCENGQVPSMHYPGGYAQSVTAPFNALARIPDELSFAEAAPMGCAGVTTYNALRHTSALPGDLVAVLGIGGLGHLGVQFSRAMDFETVAIARGTGKEADARELGAHHYVDSTAGDVGQALQALGGAAAVLATAGNSAAIGQTVGRFGAPWRARDHRRHGRPVADQPSAVDHARAQRLRPPVGHGPRSRGDDALRGPVRRAGPNRRAATQEAAEAYAAMEQGRARYRMVLTM